MPPNPSDPKWIQFRRLLLGTVVESLLDAQIAVDFRSIQIAFDPESDFRVPRFDNYMRFKGMLEAKLTEAVSDSQHDRLQRGLQRVWPQLLEAVEVPVGDKLTSEKNEVRVALEGERRITVRFDLEAD